MAFPSQGPKKVAGDNPFQRIKFKIMFYDAFCILCQSLSELYQSAGSACQQFVKTSGSAVAQQRQILLFREQELSLQNVHLSLSPIHLRGTLYLQISTPNRHCCF